MKSTKPLRCTAFEELMLAQDSPQYPCVIVYRMHGRGKIDRIRFEKAVAMMIELGERTAPLPVEVVSHRFDSEVSDSLRTSAQNLNDLLAASIFTGCEQFRATRSEQSDADWLRMMVPVSMRSTKADQQQTACNIVSAVFLDRTPVQIRDRDYLVDSIHQEMELIKNNRLALMFNFSLWLRKLVLFRNRPPQPPSKCQASMVFTNLGKIYARSSLRDAEQRIVSGGLVIETIEAIAPLTPYMCAAFSAIQYAKQLSLSLRYDPRVIKRDAAESLLDGIVADVLVQAGHSSPTSVTTAVATEAV